MAIQSYRDLRVWQRSMGIAEEVYRITSGFPREERLGMVSQMRRCATSIPANIAEGWGRRDRRDYLRYLRIAQGSLNELETHLLLSVRVGLSNDADMEPTLREASILGRELLAMYRKLQSLPK